MKWILFNDKNMTTINEEVIKGYMFLRAECILRLFTTYGGIDLIYDNLDDIISDYARIRGGHNNEKE